MMRPLLPFGILLTSILIPTTFTQTLSARSSATSQEISTVSSTAITLSASTANPTSTSPAKIRLPNGDPCGPAIQDNPEYPNTCTLIPERVQTPAQYGINCTYLLGPMNQAYSTKWDNCAASFELICTKMLDHRTYSGKWIWTKLANRCAVGFWLPRQQGSAPRPSMQRCLNIFSAIVNTCSTSTEYRIDTGSVNLVVPPGLDPAYFLNGGDPSKGPANLPATLPQGSRNGQQVNAGYPSYMVTDDYPSGSKF